MRMLLPALTLALIGTAAQAADSGVYLGAGVSQVKLDNVGKDFNTGNLNDFKLHDTSWKLIGGFRPIDNFATSRNAESCIFAAKLRSDNRPCGR